MRGKIHTVGGELVMAMTTMFTRQATKDEDRLSCIFSMHFDSVWKIKNEQLNMNVWMARGRRKAAV